MTNKNLCSLVIVLLMGFLALPVMGDGPDVSFEKDIKPILENHCINCHGPEEPEGTRLDVREDAMDYIEEGDAENSAFYEHLISDDEEELMPPPDEENPLTQEQIQLVATWINEGAEWPDGIEIVDAQAAKEAPEEDNSEEDNSDEGEDTAPAEVEVDNTVWNAIGSLHPAAIHLPIGLLIAAGLFALFSIRGNFVMSDCAYYCLWLGTIGAIIACISGWWFSPMENRGTVTEFQDLFNQDQKIFWHRTSSLVCTGFAFLLCLFAAGARAKDPDDGVLWKLGLMVLACGIAFAGHKGGELTHGKDLYKDLNKLIETVIPMEDLFGPAAKEGEQGDGADAPADESSSEATGETSGENNKSAVIE